MACARARGGAARAWDAREAATPERNAFRQGLNTRPRRRHPVVYAIYLRLAPRALARAAGRAPLQARPPESGHPRRAARSRCAPTTLPPHCHAARAPASTPTGRPPTRPAQPTPAHQAARGSGPGRTASRTKRGRAFLADNAWLPSPSCGLFAADCWPPTAGRLLLAAY